MFLKFLLVPTELPRTFTYVADHLYVRRLWLSEEAFILDIASWAIMTKINFFIY